MWEREYLYRYRCSWSNPSPDYLPLYQVQKSYNTKAWGNNQNVYIGPFKGKGDNFTPWRPLVHVAQDRRIEIPSHVHTHKKTACHCTST